MKRVDHGHGQTCFLQGTSHRDLQPTRGFHYNMVAVATTASRSHTAAIPRFVMRYLSGGYGCFLGPAYPIRISRSRQLCGLREDNGHDDHAAARTEGVDGLSHLMAVVLDMSPLTTLRPVATATS